MVFRPRDGVYWGRTIDGVYHTAYEARDGRTWQAEGLLVPFADDRAYVQTEDGWAMWRPGSEKMAIDVPADAWVRPFGKYLVRRQAEGRWMCFDPDAGTNREFTLADDDRRWIPYQTNEAIYRDNVYP
jgi:hypothetical protein